MVLVLLDSNRTSVRQAASAPVPLLPAWCRHDALAKLCMEQAKQEFASLFSGYSSNSTVRSWQSLPTGWQPVA